MCSTKVLDGGLATELVKLGYPIDGDPLWSAHLLSNDCHAIVQVHKSYLRSGADVITTASYQASIEGFQKYLGSTVNEAEELIAKSVTLGKQACDEFSKETNNETSSALNRKFTQLIAGSVGPYAIIKADGSEYTGDYVDDISCEELIEWHRPRIRCLVNAGCDILAFETIPAQKEGIALVKLLREFPNTKAWLSFCCQDAHLTAHKENFATAATKCLEIASDQLIAVGTNCCPPIYVKSLLSDIRHLPPNIAKLAYPNSGETWESTKGWTGKQDVSTISSYIQEWISVGGDWLGGCCRTTPNDIAAISSIVHCIT